MEVLRRGQKAGVFRKSMDSKLLEANLHLDPSKALSYQLMIEDLFRRYGPTKSQIALRIQPKLGTPLSAGIDPETWNTQFLLREDLGFDPSPPLLRYLDRSNIIDPIETMLKTVACHEMGHWEFPRGTQFGCPYDKPTHYTSFIEPIHDAILASGKFGKNRQDALASRIANAAMDVIDNYNVALSLSERNEKMEGQVLFWQLQGQEGGVFPPEYAMFVGLNLSLFGSSEDKELLSGFSPKDERVDGAIGRLSKIFIHEKIYDRNCWEGLATEYAREALKLMDQNSDPKHQHSAGDKLQPQKSSGGGGQEKDKGRQGNGGEEKGGGGSAGGEQESEDGGDQQGGAGGGGPKEEDEAGSGTSPSQMKKDGKKEEGSEGEEEKEGPAVPGLGDELTQDDIEKIMAGRKGGKGIPFYIKKERALDAFYKALAKRISIKAEGGMPKANFRLAPITREQYDPDVHSPEEVDLARLYLSPEDASMLPSVVKTKLQVGVPIRKEKGKMPDFMFALVDSSGSMGAGGGSRSIVPWGDNSYYHYALLTFYGLLRFFENERILDKIGIAAAIFSDATLNEKGLEEVKKLLFNPSMGGTQIDVSKVVESLKGKDDAIFSMISDGEIGNWARIKDEFIALAKRNQFFMIQIGAASQACRDLEAAGLTVKYVQSPQDIAQLAVNLTAQGYRRAIRRDLGKETRKYTKMY